MVQFARSEITPLAPTTLLPENAPANLTDAYAQIRERTEQPDFTIAAWKLGGTVEAAQKNLGISELFFAPLDQSECIESGPYAPGYPVILLKTEAEVALQISENGGKLIKQGVEAVQNADLADLFDHWSYAFEMPSPTISNAGEFGVIGIVLDRCAAGCLALGAAHPYVVDTKWADIPLVLEQDGSTIGQGNTDNLIASADICARDFLLLAIKHSFAPKAGQWIATGGMIPATNLEKGCSATLKAGDETVLNFQIGWK